VPRFHTPAATLALAVAAVAALSGCGSEAPETIQYPAATPGAARLADRGESNIPAPQLPTSEPAPKQESTGLPTYDGTLVSMVESALAAEPELNSLGIDVSAAEGTVYLRGQARTRETRRLATEVAGKVDGVKQVQNELLIAPVPESKERPVGELSELR